ncbi:unnamed protein product [Rotaria sp. Silwood1]|nr:unnamed protein product [Rotaria sp. Silwood1]CAF1629338.1 unnamed protein product [Rotaria sp. Silwood1]CAF3736688.1 unnamed protein product [Rotaria sp. Silwood1]CAF4704573.1 unnamed protein product [Rotaria sp. Silwood1]
MPPKRGGGLRGRRKGEQDNSKSNTLTTNTPQQPTTIEEKQQTTNIKFEFGIAPLILEAKSLTKVKINQLIKNHLPDVKVSNIQVNRPNTFTLYANDVKSFNRLLNDLTSIIQDNDKQCSSIYIPRSIQRILENNKEAFVKKVDLEISDEDIKQTLNEQGFKYEKITRLMNKEKIPLKTIKITFSDSSNRDLFVKLGLQIDSMHFNVEPAKHNNTPSQCYKCFKYGHVAKYCRSDNQLCSRCGGANHKYDDCPNSSQKPTCSNCKGEHFATSANCPKYKDYQQKIQKTIEQYSSSVKQRPSTQTHPDWNNKDEFPVLKSPHKNDQIQIIEILTEKMMSIIEQATQKIFDTFNQRFEVLTNQFTKKFNIEIDEIFNEEENNKQEPNNKKKSTNSQDDLVQESLDKATQNESVEFTSTPIIGSKRKYISPSSSSEKPITTVKDSKISHDSKIDDNIKPNK